MKQTKTNIFWAFLALLMGLVLMPGWVQAQIDLEDGSAEHPYLIESKQELMDLNKCMVPGSIFYFNGSTFVENKPSGTDGVNYRTIPEGGKQTYFKLTTDVIVNEGNVAGCDGQKDAEWSSWTPMEVFNGHFDGDYHIISGLYITQRRAGISEPFNEIAFITQVSDEASVKRLGIVNSYVKGQKAVGGIAGWVENNSVIDECFFEGTIVSTDENTGGIVGHSTLSTISNCYSSGRIDAQIYHVGGIVGNNEGTDVINCYTNMIITSSGSLTGPICGENDAMGSITNCYYDKQMTTISTNNLGTGKLTTEMTSASWNELGAEHFVYEAGLYPRLKNFQLQNPSVVLSVLPIFMGATSSAQYDDMSNLVTDFTLSNYPNVSWTASSWNNAIELNDLNAHLTKQGIVDLIVNLEGMQRTYILHPNIAPFVGSEQNPFIIDNLTDLNNFRNGINGGTDFTYRRFKIPYRDLPNIHWLQTSDIDMVSVPNWTSIGTSAWPFVGYYDGGHHEVLHLTYTSGCDHSLFRYTKGHIKNLGFRDSKFTCNCRSSALANVVLGGSVDSCYTTGENSIFQFSGAYNAALIRNIDGKTMFENPIRISHCYNTCDVSSSAGDVAGVIGSISMYTYLKVDHCYNTGDLTGTSQVAGVIGSFSNSGGDATGRIITSYCYNTGNLKTNTGTAAGIEAIHYSNLDSVICCFNTGNIYCEGPKDSWLEIVGIDLSWSKSYHFGCFNTGRIINKLQSTTYNGITSLSNGGCLYHCFNVGDIMNYARPASSNGQLASYTYYSYNAGKTISGLSPYACGGFESMNSFYDKTVNKNVVKLRYETALTTEQMVGEGSLMRESLGEEHWIYEKGMYPRPKWTDTCDWARNIAIAACSPVLLTPQTSSIDHVQSEVKLGGCSHGVEWRVVDDAELPETQGCLFADFGTNSCTEGVINPTLNTMCTNATTLGTYINDQLIKLVTLRLDFPAPQIILTIDSLEDLQMLQQGVNSNETFVYKGYFIPRFAENVTFSLTTDIEMSDENWIPIGGVDLNHNFGGFFLGNGHTIYNLHSTTNHAGLFGMLKGTVRDLNMEGVTITGGSYRGAICAILSNGKLFNCRAEGSISGGEVQQVASGKNYQFCTGGLVGWSAGVDSIVDCVSDVTIDIVGSYAETGGVVGSVSNSSTKVIQCANLAPITSSYPTGSTMATEYLGGICGNTSSCTVSQCYNVGSITALISNKDQNEYVGGICGNGNPTYCYNAALVDGSNRKYVGGITGSGSPQYCYNSNTVRGTGTYVGSISGEKKSPKNCYYDKQLSPIGGTAGEDVPNKAEGKTTEEMLSSQLQSVLGTSSYWTFDNFLYPQLACFAGTDASISSVMPVSLQNNEVWNRVSVPPALHRCDMAQWNIMQGACVELESEACGTIIRNGAGVSVLGAAVNDKVYRTVRLVVNHSEQEPLEIVSLDELKNFRDVINNGIGYYKYSTKHYQLALSAEDSTNVSNFMEIKDGGYDLFFKLMVDIDMSAETQDWMPIADYANNSDRVFKGDFNGGGKTISGLKVGNGDYQGLFGYNSGTIRNLTISSSTMNGSGNYKGLLCGYNYGYSISNCKIQNSKLEGESNYTGVLCGYHLSATISNCHLLQDTLSVSGNNVGGICGYSDYAIIDTCSCNNFYVTGGGKSKGGIAGYLYRGTINMCQIRNSKFDVSASNVGGICGDFISNSKESPNYIKYCINENTEIVSSSSSIGGIAASTSNNYTYFSYCTTRGGVVKGDIYVAGIVASPYLANGSVSYCVNENEIIGRSYVGGIAGQSGHMTMKYCVNRGHVKGTEDYIGGLNAYSNYPIEMQYSVNLGKVEGRNYVGGIVGHDALNSGRKYDYLYNFGSVTGTNKVGGICGKNNMLPLSNCYNAGIVSGVSQVGGITGEQTSSAQGVSNCYNIAWVDGLSMVGAVCGYSSGNKFSNCYYDKQMSPFGGVGGEEVSGITPKLTHEMLGEGLKFSLGATDWVFKDGMYPRLKQLDTMMAAIASALPVRFPASATDTVFADDVPVGHYGLAGCDSVQWIRYEGYGISFPQCDTLSVNGRNYVQIANVINGDTLKIVKLHLGISEENPLLITNKDQFMKFRDLINTHTTFYYNDVNQNFYESGDENYIEIAPCGEDMYFKLTTDVDLVDLSQDASDWTPIGDYNTNTKNMFKGHFNGDNHTISGLKIQNAKNYQGLFGYVYGTLKNVKLKDANVSGSGGNYRGALAGYNKGTVKNCSTVEGMVKGGQHVGGLLGYSTYGQVMYSYNNATVTGTHYVGGIVGSAADAGLVSQCFNTGFVSAQTTNAGGIAGTSAVEVSNCYNMGAISGKQNVAGVVGVSSTSSLRDCYNAGYVQSLASGAISMGAVTTTTNASYFPTNCYYDNQMSALNGGIGNGSIIIDNTGSTIGKRTVEMLGEGLALDTNYWFFAPGTYPRLKVMKDLDASVASVYPVLIPDGLKCDEIVLPVSVGLGEDVTWSRYGTGAAFNLSNINEGTTSIAICGTDSLMVTKGADFKVVPMKVLKMASVTVHDTTCEGYYVWAANGRVYTHSDSVTIAITLAQNCDSLMTLILTIPPALEIEMSSQNYTCNESEDAFMEAVVTGGFGTDADDYFYYWIKDGDTVYTDQSRVDNPEPGTYTLSVRDKGHPDCEKLDEVTIFKPELLEFEERGHDGQCYNQNDGFIAFAVQGGTAPYYVYWTETDNMYVGHASEDTIIGLAANTYSLKVVDDHGCERQLSDNVDLSEEHPERYTVSAFGISKKYDGIAVNPARFIVNCDTMSTPDTIASGGCKVLKNGDTLRATVSITATSVKDVMTENNNVTFSISKNGEDRTCRYNVSAENSIVEITKRNVTLTSASDQKEYSLDTLKNHNVEVGGDGFAEGEGAEFDVTGKQFKVGASNNTFTYTLNEGTNPDNYNITPTEGLLFVGAAGTVYVIASSSSKVYDGEPLIKNEYTYIGPITIEDTVLAVVEGTITDVGTQDNEITSYRVAPKANLSDVKTDQYLFGESVKGTLTVTPRTISMSTVSDSKVYDGIPLARPVVTVSGDSLLATEVTGYHADSTITDVGIVVNAITLDTTTAFKRSNYTIDLHEGTLEVTPRPLTITGESRTVDYDGNTFTLTSYTAPNLLSGHTISGLTYTATGKTVGEYTGSFSGEVLIQNGTKDVTMDYDITKTPGKLTIQPNTLPLKVVSRTDSFMYDGVAHTSKNYTVYYNGSTVNPVAAGSFKYVLSTKDTLTIVPKDKGLSGITHFVERGPNAFDIELQNRENYATITLDTGTLSIIKRPVELRSQSEQIVYSGAAIPSVCTDQSVERAGFGFVGSDDVVCTVTGRQIAVGSSENTFTYTAKGSTSLDDYNITKRPGTLTVTPAILHIVALPAERLYGVENPEFYYDVTGFVNGEDTTHGAPFVGSVRPTLHTEADITTAVGIYPITVDTTGVRFANYVAVPQAGTLTIRPRTLTIKPLPVTGITYDGNPHTWAESAEPHYRFVNSELNEHDTITDIQISGSRTVAGMSSIELSTVVIKHYDVTDLGEGNYDTTWTDVTSSYYIVRQKDTISIDPVTITIKPLPLEHVFDGHTYNSDSTSLPHYEIVSTQKLVGHDSIVAITINGSRSAFGKTPFVIDSASIKIVDTSQVHDYSQITPQQLHNAGYRIILQTDTLNIKHRNTKYPIVLKGVVDTSEYTGVAQSLSGWETTEFEFDGFTYRVEGITSKVENVYNVGEYVTAVSGTPVVRGANNADVTEEFDVTYQLGKLVITKKPLTVTARSINATYDFLEHTYNETGFPYCETPGLCSSDHITDIQLTGSLAIPGDQPIVITPNSLVIKKTSGEVVTGNYDITIENGNIHIDPLMDKIEFTIVSKTDTLVYDGQSHQLSGFDTLTFYHWSSDGETRITFKVTDVTATTGEQISKGVYKNVITGIPVVLDANNNDVTSSFTILADTGALVINQRPITVTGRDTSFYYDGLAHSAAQMSTPRYVINDSTQLLSGHNLVTDVTSKTISTLDDTAHTVVGTVTITDASSNDVTANYAITKHDGVIKINGYPQKLTISSESHQFDCYNKGQKYEHYTVKYGETACAAVAGSKYKFVLAPVTGIHDTLTITPTCLGTTNAGSHDNVKNTFTYVLQNNIQYVGTRDTIYGYLTQPDTLTLALTKDEPFCSDGSIMSLATGGNGGNKFHLSTAAATDSTTHGIYNGLSAGDYTVTVTDSKHCVATASVTLTTVEATAIEGITRAGEITTYAPDTTVDASGNLTAFPALTASGDIIAQPKLSNCTASVTDHKITVSVTVESIGVLPILVFEVSKDAGFSTTEPMYTHKVAPVTEGDKTYDFENLPTGTYYVRAKLYNCAGGSITETPESATVEVEH